MSYDLNLFLPAPGEDLEDAFERECCLGSNDLLHPPEDGLVQAETMSKKLQTIEPNLRCDIISEHVELTDPRGIQISLFSARSAAIRVPYLHYPEEIKATAKYLREYLTIFGQYGFYAQDPQFERIVPVGTLAETIIEDLSSVSAYVANTLTAVLGHEQSSPVGSQPSTHSVDDAFLPGISPLEFDLKPNRRSSGIQDKLYDYFSSRPNYQLILNRARYYNPDTDVSFEFDLPPVQKTSNRSPTRVICRIDLGRPDPFAYEANLELLAFTQSLAYQCAESPHTGNEPYSEKRFFNVWHKENPYAVRLFMFDGGDIGSYALASTALIERIWTWNRAIGQMRSNHADRYRFPKLRIWQSTHIVIEADLNCKIAVPVDHVWIAIPTDPHNVCVVESSVFESTPCELHPTDPSEHRIINLCESQSTEMKAITNAPRYPASSFFSTLVSLDGLLQQELVDSAIQANKRSSKSCLKPPDNWE